MKTLLLILSLATVMMGQAKIDTTRFRMISGKFNFINENYVIVGELVSSRYIVDSVASSGIKYADSLFHSITSRQRREHKWVYSPAEGNGRRYNCGVLHDAGGCPDGWFKGYRICRECLRKERVHEVRKVEQIKTEYEKLDEQIKKVKP